MESTQQPMVTMLSPTTYVGTRGGNAFRGVCPSVHRGERGTYLLSRPCPGGGGERWVGWVS